MEQGKNNVSVTPEHERPEALDANLKILLMIIVTGVSLGVFVTCLVLAFVLDLTVEGRAMGCERERLLADFVHQKGNKELQRFDQPQGSEASMQQRQPTHKVHQIPSQGLKRKFRYCHCPFLRFDRSGDDWHQVSNCGEPIIYPERCSSIPHLDPCGSGSSKTVVDRLVALASVRTMDA
uniref:Uncharacterized protein n=1 Tax=Oryza meridionalis TaxID=40149 RepID=A0A0E0E8T3_9ORYZ